MLINIILDAMLLDLSKSFKVNVSGNCIYLFYMRFLVCVFLLQRLSSDMSLLPESQIRLAAEDHLKHAPGRVGGGGYNAA